jgi:NTP pyrophosphatase (non-canonical NTP hydrolase)
MQLDELTQKCKEFYRGANVTWNKDHEQRDFNAILGIIGEVGELAEPIKKTLFHGKSYDSNMILKEVGDVLYYLAVVEKDEEYAANALVSCIQSAEFKSSITPLEYPNLTTRLFEIPDYILSLAFNLPQIKGLFSEVRDMCVVAMDMNYAKLKERYPNGFSTAISSAKEDEKH